MQEINLRQLRVFVTLATQQNMGLAAEQLYLTRGAVSQALKALEQTLGTALFDRQAQRLHLNSAGHQLLPLAHEMLARQQQIQQLFQVDSQFSPLRLGASQTIGSYLLPTLLTAPLRALLAPSLVQQNSHALQQQLLHYQLDLALIESDSLLPGLQRIAWRQDPMWLICPPDHPLAGTTVPWSALNGQPFILREPFSGSREQFDLQLAPHLTELQISFEMNSLTAIVRAVSTGAGLSLVSALACQDAVARGELALIELPQPILRQLWICYPPANQQLPALQQLLKLLKPAG